MKIIYLFLILSVITGIVRAQPFGRAANEYRIIKSVYENSSGEKGNTTFNYDYENKLIKAFWTLNDKSRYSNNYYEHDTKGNIVSAFRDFSDSLTSFEMFIYDSIGNKTSEYFYRSDSVSGSATYLYKDQLLIKAFLKKHKGWINGNIDYEYDKHGRKAKGVLKRDEKNICEIHYTYDISGNLVKEFWDYHGKWSQTFYYVYEKMNPEKKYYSSPFLTPVNHRIKNETYTFNNEIGGPSEYIYDKKGLLTKKVFTRTDGVLTKTHYQYDKTGKLLSSLRTFSDSSTMNFKYEYDENNKLIERYCYQDDSLIGFESFLYNAEGILTKGYLKSFDKWITGTLVFENNEFGSVSSGKFKGENGFDADIAFHYNEGRLLTEIIWNFSSGKFQKYQFEYEELK